jgi:hypothetical protein
MLRCTSLPTSIIILIAAASVAACRRDDGETASTTTIRSGTPPPLQQTRGAGPSTSSDPWDPVPGLAGAICGHERACATVRGGVNTEALLLQEQNCMAELTPSVALTMSQLDCSPAVARASLEECIAAVRAERCSTPMSNYPTPIAACRPTEMCRRGQNAH